MNRPSIKAIQARAAAATPGPWVEAFHCGCGMPGCRNCRLNDEHGYPVAGVYRKHTEWSIHATGDIGDIYLKRDNGTEDSEFIAAARTDVPELIAYIEHLEAQRAELLPFALEGACADTSDWRCRFDSQETLDAMRWRLESDEFGPVTS